MKKQALIVGMVAMLVVSTSGLFTVSAHGGYRHHRHHHGEYNDGYDNRMQAKRDARWILRRTATVLQRAQEMAAENGEFRNHRHHGRHHGMRHRGLGRAFAFQQRARDLFFAGDYDSAIQLSLRSRAIALRVIRRMEGWDTDNGNWRDDDDNFSNCDMDRGELDDVEVRYWDRRPDESKLDVHVNGHDVDDDVAVKFHIDLDF